MESRFKVDLMVGVFVFGTLIVFAVFLLRVSDQAGLFSKKAIIKTSFAEATGLGVGSPVRFQGTSAGEIKAINVPPPISADEAKKLTPDELATKSRVIVELEIEDNLLENIGKDARAEITNEGLLGDNLVRITRGTPETVGHLEDGDFIPGTDASGLLDALNPVAETLEQILKDIQRDNQAGIEDKKTEIGVMLGNMANITEDINKGKGTLGALINDPAGQGTAKNVEQITRNFADLSNEIAHGDGSMHQIMYGEELAKTMKNVEGLTGNLDSITGKLDEQNVEADIKKILVNVEGMTKNLDSITKKIDQGEGTAGAIINDRKMYEDISSLLQGANRSEIVRTAVRHVWNTKLREAEAERERRSQEIQSQPAPAAQ